ncbi:MAG: branched-chain amino acid ABC transporter permease [Acidimicrobiia bacterium]
MLATTFWHHVTQIVVYTLTIGSIYGLVAFAYSLVFSTTKIVNFAQGTLVIVGGYLAWDLYTNRFDGSVVMPVVLLLVVGLGAVLGMMFDLVAIAPLGKFDPTTNISWLVTTFGAGIFVQELVSKSISDSGQKLDPLASKLPWLGTGKVVQGVSIEPADVFLVLLPILIVVLLELLQGRTKIGRAFRAVSQDRGAASLMGINPTAMVMLSFVIAGAIAALAGVLVAPRLFVRFNIGLTLGVYGFIAAVIGGLGSTRGAVIGGYTIAFVEGVVGEYNLFHNGEVYKPIFVFVAFILVLTLKPTGLFGKPAVEKV